MKAKVSATAAVWVNTIGAEPGEPQSSWNIDELCYEKF